MLSSLKKVWSFVKSYWHIPLTAVVAFVGLVVFRNKSGNVSKIMDASRESFEKQKDAIVQAEKEKVTKKQQIEQEYQDAVRSIEKVYKAQKKSLDDSKKKEIKKAVKKHYNDPKELSSEISNLFGLKYVPKKRNSNTD